MKGLIIKGLINSALALLLLMPGKFVSAQNYTDSLTFTIDSAKIDGNYLEYSIMYWRTNEDWTGGGLLGTQDTTLGNTDLYFRIQNAVFDTHETPGIVRHHPNLDIAGSGSMVNLLNVSTGYYAYRFAVSLKYKPTVSPSMKRVEILWNKPVELCRVRLKMSNPDQNPGLYWDTLATGGQSTTGEPLIMTLNGDVRMNPDGNIVLVDYSKTQYVCEGGEAKIWAKGHSAGSGLKIAWYMSDKPDCVTQYNAGNGVKFTSNVTGNLTSGQVHVASVQNTAKWGKISYHITCANDNLERVDTLHIFNFPAVMDSVYFMCELSDATTTSAARYSTNGNTPATRTQVLIRDSLFGWLAASDPGRRDDHTTTGAGMSDHTDTVLKCPTSGAIVSFFFFGPECGTDKEIIGNSMILEYQWLGELGATGTDMATVSSWEVVTGVTAPNGRCLYKGTILTDKKYTNKEVWIKSIATEVGCHNGSSYAKYDTIFIKDLPQDGVLVAAITDTTLSTGESMNLDTRFTYTLKTPAKGTINAITHQYTAPSTSCTDPNGCRDTIVYKYNMNPGDGSTCQMELVQVVNLSDWYYLKVKVFLEGPMQSNGEMASALQNLFPRNGAGRYESPYNTAVQYPVLPVPTSSTSLVDWIKISLRDPANLSSIYTSYTSVSAFLTSDGMVCDSVGNLYVKFKNLPQTSYYVMIEHRNHLTVMSASPVTLSTSSASCTTIDFSIPANVYGANIKMLYGVGVLYGGDVTRSGVIDGASKTAIEFNKTPLAGYHDADLNMDGVVDQSDLSLGIISNIDANKSVIF